MTANQSIKPVTTKINENGHLEIGGCDLVELAEKYGTPLYVFDEKTIRTIANEYKTAFKDYPNINMLYAAKAFMTKAICKIMSSEGSVLTLFRAAKSTQHILRALICQNASLTATTNPTRSSSSHLRSAWASFLLIIFLNLHF